MIVLAIALTAVAGYVDAVGYLVLAHVFTANMSGNTIAVGRAIVDGDWSTYLLALWFAYLLFAAFGVAAQMRWGLASLAVPIALVVFVSIVLFVRSI